MDSYGFLPACRHASLPAAVPGCLLPCQPACRPASLPGMDSYGFLWILCPGGVVGGRACSNPAPHKLRYHFVSISLRRIPMDSYGFLPACRHASLPAAVPGCLLPCQPACRPASLPGMDSYGFLWIPMDAPWILKACLLRGS